MVAAGNYTINIMNLMICGCKGFSAYKVYSLLKMSRNTETMILEGRIAVLMAIKHLYEFRHFAFAHMHSKHVGADENLKKTKIPDFMEF